QKPYATSWTLGGTTRASETLTIPTAGVFQKGNWAVELTYISKIVAYSNYPRLFHCGIDANNYYDIAITPDGRIYGEVRSEGTNYALFSSPIVVGTAYSIMFSGDGTCIRLCINGLEYSRLYVEPIGTLLSSVNIGSSSSKQCNGIIDDLRISNRARTLAEHQSAYQSNQPLAVDTSTTCKLNFDGSLDAIGVGPTPTRFIYDYNNRLDYIEMPSGGVIDYQYDANGNLIRRTIH
ncbi:MAG: LamG-like jellyroll fold domain-containing protein, partial [Dehalobacterium sp.]